MIRHMRHGSPPRLLPLQSILSPNRRESLPTPSPGVRITCSTSAATTAPPASIEPPGPKPSKPGPRSPAWPLGHKHSWDRPSCALSRPEPIKLTVPSNQIRGLMKTFGLVVPAGKGSRFEAHVRALLADQEGLAPILLPLLEAWR